jgi:hypothetical protein
VISAEVLVHRPIFEHVVAMASLPFEQPKLMAVAQVNEQFFAELLERRLNKIEEARLIEPKPRRILRLNERMGVVDALGVSYLALFLIELVTIDTEDKQSNGR